MYTETIGGVNVTRIPGGKFKTAHVAALIRRPLDRDEAAINALLARVLKRGQAAHPTRQSIARRAEALYGAAFDVSILKKGEEQLIQAYAETLDTPEAYAGAARLALGALFAPLPIFDDAAVAVEKARLRQNFAARKDDPRAYAKDRLVEEMCADEPFGVYGDGYPNEAFDNIDGAALYRHYRRVIDESAIEVVTLGGNGAEADILRGLAPSPRRSAPIPARESSCRTFQTISEPGGGAAGKLCVGFRAEAEPTGELYYPLLIANEIFGGGAESLLFTELREQAGLCYYASSFVYRFKSIVVAECGVDGRDAPRAAALIQSAAKRLASGMNRQNIEAAKTALTRRLAAAKDDPAALMDFTLTQRLLGDSDGVDEAVEKIRAATKADCQEAANWRADTAYILEGGASA